MDAAVPDAQGFLVSGTKLFSKVRNPACAPALLLFAINIS